MIAICLVSEFHNLVHPKSGGGFNGHCHCFVFVVLCLWMDRICAVGQFFCVLFEPVSVGCWSGGQVQCFSNWLHLMARAFQMGFQMECNLKIQNTPIPSVSLWCLSSACLALTSLKVPRAQAPAGLAWATQFGGQSCHQSSRVGPPLVQSCKATMAAKVLFFQGPMWCKPLTVGWCLLGSVSSQLLLLPPIVSHRPGNEQTAQVSWLQQEGLHP